MEGGGGSKRKRANDDEDDDERANSKLRRVEKEAQFRVREKVKEIVEREFAVSLKAKEEEVDEIDQRILNVRKALQIVRYGVVANYYAESVVKQTTARPEEVSVHPSTRALLKGKRPKEEEEETGKKVDEPKTATTLVSTMKQETAEPPKEVTPKPEPTKVVSSHDPFKSSETADPTEFTPRGERHKTKRRFIVGNVSKWIECDQREDLATHKWMIYVRGDEASPDVSDVVAKVKFLIHPSYHPHDLVEVKDPPFHLTRRGWGEFPARVQVHFKNERDKPIDIIHHLKLDRSYTGLQTRGSETVVDVWLHSEPRKVQLKKPAAVKTEPCEPQCEGWVIPHGEPNPLLPTSFVETMQDPVLPETKSEKKPVKTSLLSTPIKTEPLTSLTPTPPSSTQTSPTSPQTTYIRCKDKDGEPYYLPVALLPNNHKKQVDMPVQVPGVALKKPPLVSRTKSANIGITPMTNGHSQIKLAQPETTIVKVEPEPLPTIVKKSNGQSLIRVNHQTVFQPSSIMKMNSMTVSSAPPPVNLAAGTSLLRGSSNSALPPGTSLLKRNISVTPTVSPFHSPCPSPVPSPSRPNSSCSVTSSPSTTELEKATPNVKLAVWNKILGRGGEETQAEVENRLAKKGMHLLKRQIKYFVFLSENLFHLKADSFSSAEACIMHIARYIPLVTPLAKDNLYRALHPYSAPNEKVFKSWNAGKQLSAEWQRAKFIQRIIDNFDNLKGAHMSTSVMVKLLRLHGYSFTLEVPVSSAVTLDFPTRPPKPVDEVLDMDLLERLRKEASANEDEEIDVVGEVINNKPVRIKTEIKQEVVETEEEKTKPAGPVSALLLPEDNVGALKYIEETAAQIGVKMAPEEVAPRVFYPAAQKLIYRACKNLSECLLRKSFKSAYDRYGAPPALVTPFDIYEAVHSNEIFSLFTEDGLGPRKKTTTTKKE